jgi:hypothetical protein
MPLAQRVNLITDRRVDEARYSGRLSSRRIVVHKLNSVKSGGPIHYLPDEALLGEPVRPA